MDPTLENKSLKSSFWKVVYKLPLTPYITMRLFNAYKFIPPICLICIYRGLQTWELEMRGLV